MFTAKGTKILQTVWQGKFKKKNQKTVLKIENGKSSVQTHILWKLFAITSAFIP